MPQIASSDVVYTVVEGSGAASAAAPGVTRTFVIQFGNGSLTYTNGGIPLDKQKLGCPTSLGILIMMDEGSTVGYVPKWNMTANTVRLYNDANVTAAAASALVELSTAAAVTSTTLRVRVSGY